MSGGDLREQLQHILGTSFAVGEELGGGGMSRVFVAQETALGRRVVVKVLPPDLAAGVNAERFHREIQLAASLQHSHIVPLLSAGQQQGLTYYTMPFVEGETLRARLARGGELPVAEVVRILRDVAKALSYAHRRGIVHRDIKPENVLLSDSSALVADFGVAKALSASSGGGATPAALLTSVGMALGTPTYMSPEQAAGDPNVDHRADIYALGVLGYELLSGVPPFSGRPPQALLAAHALEVPAPLSRKRSGVPTALTALVMRCLEKRPSDRPQSADEILIELETLPAASGSRAAAPGAGWRSRSRVLAAGGALAVAAVAIALLARRPLAAGNLDQNLVAVSPFRISGADPSLAYLREGMLDLLAAKLNGEGGPRALDPRTVLSAWRSAGAAAGADVPQRAMLRTAAGLGAGQLLLGGVVGAPGRLVINASLLSVPSGAVRAEATVEGPQDSLPALVDRLTAQLLALEAGERGHRLTKLTSASLPALRAYLDGQAAYRRGEYRTAGEHFNRAVELDSTFGLAALALASATQWTFDWDLRERAVHRAWMFRDRLSEVDRAQLMARAGSRYPEAQSWTEYIALADTAVRAAPDRADVWFMLGDVLFHFGPFTSLAAAHQQSQAAFERALSLDSSFAAPVEHLVELAALAGDTARVRVLSGLYLAYHPTADLADFTRWRAAHVLRDEQALSGIRSRLRDMQAPSLIRIVGIAQMTGMGLEDAELAARTALERAGSARERQAGVTRLAQLLVNLGRTSEGWSLMASTADENDPALLTGLLQGAMTYGADTAQAESAARRLGAFVRHPPASDVMRGQQYRALCWLARWRLARGDRSVAATAVTRLPALGAATPEAPAGPVPLGQPAVCAELLKAELAVAERSSDAARAVRHADSLMRLGPLGPDVDMVNLVLSQLYDRLGNREAALTAIRRRAYNWDESALWYLPDYLRQEGRLAAAAGERESAVRAYRQYLALRAAPDSALRAEADEVRAELARLETHQRTPHQRLSATAMSIGVSP